MEIWIVLLIVGIVGVLWYMGYTNIHEGFVNDDTAFFNKQEQLARSEGVYGEYVTEQTDLFHKQQPPTGIYASRNVNSIPDFADKINSALHTILGFPTSPPEADYNRTVRRITVTPSKDMKQTTCNGIVNVEDLPTAAGSFCGWYYIPDSETTPQQSIALLGTENGPDPDIRINGVAISEPVLDKEYTYKGILTEDYTTILEDLSASQILPNLSILSATAVGSFDGIYNFTHLLYNGRDSSDIPMYLFGLHHDNYTKVISVSFKIEIENKKANLKAKINDCKYISDPSRIYINSIPETYVSNSMTTTTIATAISGGGGYTSGYSIGTMTFKFDSTKTPYILYPNGRKWFWHTNKTAAIQAESEKKCKRITTCAALNPTENCAFNTKTGRGEYYNRKNPPPNTELITSPLNCSVPFCQANGVPITTGEGRRSCILQLMDVEGISTRGFLRTNVKAIPDPIFVKLLNAVHSRANTPTTLQVKLVDLSGGNTVIPLEFRNILQYWKRLTTSYDPVLKDVSQMFVYGELLDGRIFNDANYYMHLSSAGKDEQSELAVNILQRAWRKAGCQPTGSGYPTQTVVGRSFVDLEKEYQETYNSMFNTDNSILQRESVQKCLNRNARMASAPTSMPANYCNERGIEYFLYDGKGENAMFIGHLYSNVGLLVDPRTRETPYKVAERMRDILLDAQRYPEVSYRARTMVSVPTNTTMLPNTQFYGTYNIKLNNSNMDSKTITLPTGIRNTLEIEYSGPRTAAWGSPSYDYINMNLDRFQLYQDSSKPVLSFDFFKGNTLDSNRLAKLLDTRGILKKEGNAMGYAAIPTTPPAGLKISPSIRSSMIQIISLRVFLKGDTILFAMEDAMTPNYNEVAEIRGNIFRYIVNNAYEKRIYEIPITNIQYTWTNIQIQFLKNAANTTMSIVLYINQIRIGEAAAQSITDMRFKRPMDIYILRGLNGTLGWFHMYDRMDINRVGNVEGFQSSSLSILQQEGDYNPQERLTYNMIRAPLVANTDYMVSNIPNNKMDTSVTAVTATASAPTPASAPSQTVAASKDCPRFFEPQKYVNAISANYVKGVKYNEKINAVGKNHINQTFEYAKQCEDMCKVNCVAYTFNPIHKTCTTYSNLGNNLMTEAEEGAFTAILETPKDATYDDLLDQTKNAIANYKALKQFFVTNDLYNQLFLAKTGDKLYDYMLDGTVTETTNTSFKGIQKINDPRLDKDIENDLKLLDAKAISIECLYGMYQKYSM